MKTRDVVIITVLASLLVSALLVWKFGAKILPLIVASPVPPVP